ncbi:MAG: GNAT family N-acetyltransferase [bacterium]|nr:GNAT family N-acetyltransferase [bacterium]
MSQFTGWSLDTQDSSLAHALVNSGATLTRHALIMSCPLDRIGPARPFSEGFELGDVPTTSEVSQWLPVLQSWQAAFPPGHPDYLDMSDPPTAVQFFMRLVDGSEMGPLHRSSCLLIDADGRARAGIIVNIRAGDPPSGGPWISDIWRDPSLRGSGVGPSLIDRAKSQLVEDGYSALTLAVTATNDAARTYEREGFALVMDSKHLSIPD